jgi:pyruvate dehydrogenase (quinone)
MPPNSVPAPDDWAAPLDPLRNPQELAMPPTIPFQQVGGFGLWAQRAFINGRGDELVDSAKTNLREE